MTEIITIVQNRAYSVKLQNDGKDVRLDPAKFDAELMQKINAIVNEFLISNSHSQNLVYNIPQNVMPQFQKYQKTSEIDFAVVSQFIKSCNQAIQTKTPQSNAKVSLLIVGKKGSSFQERTCIGQFSKGKLQTNDLQVTLFNPSINPDEYKNYDLFWNSGHKSLNDHLYTPEIKQKNLTHAQGMQQKNQKLSSNETFVEIAQALEKFLKDNSLIDPSVDLAKAIVQKYSY